MIPLVWVTVAPMIEAAIEYSHGELDLSDIQKRLMDEEMLLLAVSKGKDIVAALTVEKRIFASGKIVMNITTAGGEDLHLWMEKVNSVIDNLALEHKCTEIYIVGRPGWMRMLKNIGYGKIHTVVSKKVGE